MKGFILAAGEGTRMRPLTHYFPKPLLLLYNKPIISYPINRLKNAGIKIIAANTYYMKDSLRNYLMQEKIFISEEESLLGTAGGIGNAKKLLLSDNTENVILYNSDVVSNIDINILVREHLKNGSVFTMALYDYEKINSVCVDNNLNVIKFKRSEGEEDRFKYFTYTGIAIINKKLIEKFPFNEFGNLISYLKNEIRNKFGSVKGVLFNKQKYYWFDCGHMDTYFNTNKFLFEKSKNIDESIFQKTDNVFTYKLNTIPQSTVFKGFNIIGKNVVIEEDVQMKNVIVYDNAKILKGMHLKNVVAGEKFVYSIA